MCRTSAKVRFPGKEESLNKRCTVRHAVLISSVSVEAGEWKWERRAFFSAASRRGPDGPLSGVEATMPATR